jgi:hypothetical protein
MSTDANEQRITASNVSLLQQVEAGIRIALAVFQRGRSFVSRHIGLRS